MNDFVNGAIHDLKTPISAVKGYVDLIRHVGPLNERQQHYAERALLALEGMQALVENLLDYARLDSGAPLSVEAVDLRVLVNEAADLLRQAAEQANVLLVVEQPDTPQIVTGERRLLAQAIHNLIGNAIKYNKAQGQATVRITSADGDALQVEVQDTGIGIAPEEHAKLFTPFYRVSGSKKQGNGLGLALVAQVAARHNGAVGVSSTLGAGSTFTFTIPLEHTPDSTPNDSEVSALVASRGFAESIAVPATPPRPAADDLSSNEELDAVDDDLQEQRRANGNESSREQSQG
jgi:two-component system, sensor histidine kinase and response regulator